MFFKSTKWKRFLLGGGFATIFMFSGCQLVSNATTEEQRIDLTFSSFMPGPHPQHTTVIIPFLDDLEAATDGRVTGTMYTGNALGASNTQYDLVVNGIADMSLALHGYTPARFPLTGVSELPFMGGSAEEASKILWSLHEQFPEIEAEHKGTKIGWIFKNDPAQILTVDQPIYTPEDLEGMKIRTPSSAGNDILEAWGAIPVSIPMSDVYESMQKGVIDGALAPASAIKNFQLADVTRYITRGDFYTSSEFVVMNPDTWDRILPEDQIEMETLMGERLAEQAAKVYDEDGIQGWEAAKEAGVEIYELNEEELAEWENRITHLYEEWVEEMDMRGFPGRELYEESIRLRDEGE